MAVIKVENFGGEMPSVSPRALPAEAAQTNTNLFLATREFRPLASDTTITAGLTNAKTLFRIDAASAWVTSLSEISYARGQNFGDTTKRTYYSNNTTPGPLRTFDKDGNDRQLGVPAPAALTVTTTQGAFFTADSLATAVQQALIQSINITEPGIRYTGSTPIAGPLSLPAGDLFFPTDTTNLPSAVTNAQQYWNLYAKVPLTRITALRINTPDIAGAFTDSTHTYIPITALPYAYIENGTVLATSLPLIVNPRTSTQVLTTAQINALRDEVYRVLDPDENAYSLRTELTDIVLEFFNLLFNYPAAQADIPSSGGDTDPTGPGPTIPTTQEWVEDTGVYVMASEWLTYYGDLAGYTANLATYNINQTAANTANRSASDRLADLQNRARQATKTIEQTQLAVWEDLTENQVWVSSAINAAIAGGELETLDAPRVIQTRFYLVTFVTDRNEESAPSPPSAQQDVDQYSSTVVTRPTVPTSRFIDRWRIYRSATTGDLTTFQFIGEFPTATASYSDVVSNEALGELIPTVGWDEPVSGLKGLTSMPNGIMAAFKDNTLHFSEPYAPYAFPPAYQIVTEFPIVGLGVFGQTLFVGTTGNPYLVSGSDSASMSAVKLESNQSCVARRSIATVPGGVIYASPDGLCLVTGGSVQVITRSVFTREDWQALTPASIFGVAHEDIYYFFYDTGSDKGSYAFDLQSIKLGVVNGFTSVTALFSDLEADELYANDAASIKELFSTARRTATWLSPLITFPAQVPMAWLKVYGDQTSQVPVTVKWYGDGVLRHTVTITNIEPVRLPAGRWLEHEVQLESSSRVTKLVFAGSTQELQGL